MITPKLKEILRPVWPKEAHTWRKGIRLLREAHFASRLSPSAWWDGFLAHPAPRTYTDPDGPWEVTGPQHQAYLHSRVSALPRLVRWLLPRAPVTEELAALKLELRADLTLDTVSIAWQATANEKRDLRGNQDIWKSLPSGTYVMHPAPHVLRAWEKQKPAYCRLALPLWNNGRFVRWSLK